MANTVETLLNGELARLLREHGFDAEAEQKLTDSGGKLHWVDVLIDLEDRVVAIEAEFHPAATVRKDAAGRLGEVPLRWRGMPIESVFEVVYPAQLKHVSEGRARKALKSSTLSFEELSRSEDGGIQAGVRQRGTLGALAELLHDYWVRHTRELWSNLVYG